MSSAFRIRDAVALPSVNEDISAPRFPADGWKVFYVGDKASIVFYSFPAAGGPPIHMLTVDMPKPAFDRAAALALARWYTARQEAATELPEFN